MTDADANEAIAQHWRAGWDALHGPLTADAVTDVLEGEIGESGTEWVRMAVKPPLSQLQTLDARQRQRTAIIWVQIFTTATAGTRRASELVDDVRSVLEAKVIEPLSGDERISTFHADVEDPGSDGAWLMRLVKVTARWYG